MPVASSSTKPTTFRRAKKSHLSGRERRAHTTICVDEPKTPETPKAGKHTMTLAAVTMPRQQRRAEERRLRKHPTTKTAAEARADAFLREKGFFDLHNNVSQAGLTGPAYKRLYETLVGYGNRLSAAHAAALYSMLVAMTRMAQGRLAGRWAFGLPTGTGKTQAIVAWIATLHELGLDHVSVAISASKVEALCELKRDLLKHGVPADKIGLLHGYRHDPKKDGNTGSLPDGYASEPADKGEDRQFMLVTHARVRDRSKMDEFSHYQGRPRDLLLYDESLVVSDATSVPVRDLKGAVGWLAAVCDDSPKLGALVNYLTECRDTIAEALDTADHSGDQASLIRLPYRDAETLERYKAQLGRYPAMESARTLLDIATEELRVVSTGQGGAVWYRVSVPPELKNIIILDASHPIRRLCQLDSSINDAEKSLPEVRNVGVPLSQIKNFDYVTIHQRFSGGGRDTLRKDFTRGVVDRRTTKEVAEVIRQLPIEEAVLCFVFKTRTSERVDYARVLRNDLETSGIDPDATVIMGGKERPRINIVTWGNETASNVWSYCQNVILVGVLQRSPVDLAAAYLGQVDDLAAAYSGDAIKDLLRSEVCHVIYQALSRGSCRTAYGGQAAPMRAWLIHRDDRIQRELARVMPGVQWAVWEKSGKREKTGIIAESAMRISGHLDDLPRDTQSLSSRQLKNRRGALRAAHPHVHLGIEPCPRRSPRLDQGGARCRSLPCR